VATPEGIQVYEDGQMRRDFIHVRDVAGANAAVLAAELPAGFRAYNTASGQARTIGTVAAAVARAAGGRAPVTCTGYSRPDDVRHLVATPAALMRAVPWRPAVEFEAGLSELVAETVPA
jgi:dTDP-L-rhamnose 4-epimerase